MNKYREITVLCIVVIIITLCLVMGPKKTLDTVIGVKETVSETKELVEDIDTLIKSAEEMEEELNAR